MKAFFLKKLLGKKNNIIIIISIISIVIYCIYKCSSKLYVNFIYSFYLSEIILALQHLHLQGIIYRYFNLTIYKFKYIDIQSIYIIYDI